MHPLFRFLFRSGLLFLAATSLQTAHANSLADDLMGSLFTMKSVYRAAYAPAEWKKKYAGYDLDDSFNLAAAAVQAHPNMSVKESRGILKDFIYAMKDYHTSISFVSTEAASLPFQVAGAGDRFFLAYIDRTKLTETAFPYHEGDEVTSFDGQPTLEAVQIVQAQTPANVPATDRALAEMSLTRRRGSRGLDIPQGPVRIGLLPKGQTREVIVQMVWEYTPEKIAPRQQLHAFSTLVTDAPLSASPLLHPQMTVKLEDSNTAENPFGIGSRRSFTPALGMKVWESASDSVFDAYIYKADNRRLMGYVRIPSYVPQDAGKAIAEFASIIGRFETTTDAMVIDQVNNPGGSVFYLYALASMLSDQPLRTPQHRMAINQKDISESLDLITKLQAVKTDEDAQKILGAQGLDGYPGSYELAQFTLNYSQFLVSEWNAGHRLTTPYWIGGVDQINPAKVHYTKPILLLTNHLDFSGGDFFPTILQDNQRVTVMGSRTAGAGGYVNDVSIPNDVGIDSFRVTQSIAERVSGNPIENLGVTPDVVYEMTAEDRTQGYLPYVRAIQTQLSSMAEKSVQKRAILK